MASESGGLMAMMQSAQPGCASEVTAEAAAAASAPMALTVETPAALTASASATASSQRVPETMRTLCFSPEASPAATSDPSAGMAVSDTAGVVDGSVKAASATATAPVATAPDAITTGAMEVDPNPAAASPTAVSQTAPSVGPVKRPSEAMTPDVPPIRPKVKVYCDWTRHTSPAGLEYFYNRVTKTSVWEQPAAYTLYLKKSGKTPDGPLAKRPRLSQEERAALDQQAQLRIQEREAARLAKAQEKAEREAKKAADAEARRLEKLKREAEKEAARKAKEEERARKKAEKEAAEAEKAAEREKKKAEAEAARILKKEEEEKLRLKKLGVSKGQASTFKSFFKPATKKPAAPAVDPAAPKSLFTPFHAPAGMVVASIARGGLSGEEMAKLDAVLESDGGDVDLGFLVDQWKKLRAAQQPAPAAVAAAGRVSPVSPTDIVAPDSTPMDLDLASATSAARPPMKLKLFQFSEDKRPAFYGTYRRRSAVVRGRRPFKCEANLDYEYDSGEDWEEEVEGDDCSNADSDSEGEKEPEEVDDGFVVAHGYLSDDEGADAELAERGGAPKAPSKDDDAGRAKPTKHPLNFFGTRPHSYGCLWGSAASDHPVLGKYKMVPLEPMPINVDSVAKQSQAELAALQSADAAEASQASSEPAKSKGSGFPANLLPDLIKAVHGSCVNVDALTNDFVHKHTDKGVTKVAVRKMVNDKAFCIREVRSPYKIQRRFVLPTVLAEHGLSNLPLPEPKAAPKVPAELMPALIRRVHGSGDSVDAIINDFFKEHGEAAGVTRMAVKRTLNDPTFAVREIRSPYTSQRRFVLPAVLTQFDLENTPLPDPPVAKPKPKSKKGSDGNGGQASLLKAFKPLA